MSIREVTVSENVERVRKHKLVRIIITEGPDFFAVWNVELPNGKTRERSVQVSEALRADIAGRPGFALLVNDIRDDTKTPAGAV